MSRVKEILLGINFFSMPSNISMHNNLFAGILKETQMQSSRVCAMTLDMKMVDY